MEKPPVTKEALEAAMRISNLYVYRKSIPSVEEMADIITAEYASTIPRLVRAKFREAEISTLPGAQA